MDLEVMTAISLAVSITAGVLTYKNKMGKKSKKQKFIEQAETDGCVVEGTVEKVTLFHGVDDSKSIHMRHDSVRVKYKYTVNGQDYFKSMTFQSLGVVATQYPHFVKVYYDPQNPKKAVCREEASEDAKRQSGCLLTIAVVVLSMIVMMNILRTIFS